MDRRTKSLEYALHVIAEEKNMLLKEEERLIKESNARASNLDLRMQEDAVQERVRTIFDHLYMELDKVQNDFLLDEELNAGMEKIGKASAEKSKGDNGRTTAGSNLCVFGFSDNR